MRRSSSRLTHEVWELDGILRYLGLRSRSRSRYTRPWCRSSPCGSEKNSRRYCWTRTSMSSLWLRQLVMENLIICCYSTSRAVFSFLIKGCHHHGGSLIYWAHVKSLIYKATVQLTKASYTWIVILYINHNFNWDSTATSPCWHRVWNLWPSDPDHLGFAAEPSLQDWATVWVPFKWPILWGTALLQSPASCLDQG